jgi:hypothetical protein
VQVQVHFCINELNPHLIRTEPDCTGFIFHPRVHPKSEKTRNQKNSKGTRNLKKPETKKMIETQKTPKNEHIYKIRQARVPDFTRMCRFRCQIQSTRFFDGSDFLSTPCTRPIIIPSCGDGGSGGVHLLHRRSHKTIFESGRKNKYKSLRPISHERKSPNTNYCGPSSMAAKSQVENVNRQNLTAITTPPPALPHISSSSPLWHAPGPLDPISLWIPAASPYSSSSLPPPSPPRRPTTRSTDAAASSRSVPAQPTLILRSSLAPRGLSLTGLGILVLGAGELWLGQIAEGVGHQA